jgi:hypothetical protein
MTQLLDHDPSSDGVFDRTKRKAVLLQARTRQRESQLPSAPREHTFVPPMTCMQQYVRGLWRMLALGDHGDIVRRSGSVA